MKNKYYTPKIEEFHVGFEYEIKLNSSKWEKHVFKPNEHNFSHRFKEETWFTKEQGSRVKYLDKEDIESLGFKLWQIVEDNLSFEFNIDLNGYTIGTVYFNDDNTIDTLELYNTIFTLKNKSKI